MASLVPTAYRDAAITAFRQRICATLGVTPFVHQQRWWSETDGCLLLDEPGEGGVLVQLPDRSIQPYLQIPRPGGRARVVAELGAFKTGKSFGAGLWAAAFGCIPGARVSLVGSEYDTCEPEFSYLSDALLSDRGMRMTATSLQNRPRDGKMWLDLPNGARFEAKSWERKDTLKGKEIDAYIFCEAYQLPGLECYTEFSQNLVAREGYAILATTPDRPWVKELHDRGHSPDPIFRAWTCICGIPRAVNPYTFDEDTLERDRALMTREKFQIAHLGQLGEFVGSVFNYQRGQQLFTPATHPALFVPGADPRWDTLRVPQGWDIVLGADTGTFSSAGLVALNPEGDAFVLAEFPNYRYVGGSIELDERATIPSWTRQVVEAAQQVGARPIAWADANSQFKQEVQHYGLTLLNSTMPLEARTEIAREYLGHGHLWLAPWLSILPFELEHASWPVEATSAGKYARVKEYDHTLDWLEHILAHRPRGHELLPTMPPQTWAESMGYLTRSRRGNVHLGSQ